MNSTEIKEVLDSIVKKRKITLSLEEAKVVFLGEIALQLAALYEHFEAVDEHVFGDKRG